MHHFSFGGNYLRNMLVSDGVNNANGQFNFTGQYTGDGLVDFMEGRIQWLYQGNNSGADFRKNYGAFIFGQHLVQPAVDGERGFAFGHRAAGYRNHGPRRPASHRQASPPGPDPLYIPQLLQESSSTGTRGFRRPLHGKWNRLEPRFGIVFDPRGEGKRVFPLPESWVSRSRRSITTHATHRCRPGATPLR